MSLFFYAIFFLFISLFFFFYVGMNQIILTNEQNFAVADYEVFQINLQ